MAKWPFAAYVVGGEPKTTPAYQIGANGPFPIWVARLSPSLKAGAHAIEVHVVDEYGRDYHDSLILEVTA
jgi:hypothetical protein